MCGTEMNMWMISKDGPMTVLDTIQFDMEFYHGGLLYTYAS